MTVTISGEHNSFRNEFASSSTLEWLAPHDPRRQPQRVVRLPGQPHHPKIRLHQPKGPALADPEIEPASDLTSGPGLIRTPAVTDTVRADRHAEDLHRALRADDTRLQRHERGETSVGPGRERGSGQEADLAQTLAPGGVAGLRGQVQDQTEPAATPRRAERKTAAMGELAVRTEAGIPERDLGGPRGAGSARHPEQEDESGEEET